MDRTFLAVAAAALSAAPLPAQAPQPPSPNADLPAWLAGTWALEHGSDWADEVWTAPRGGMMLGLGRNGFGPDVTSWESIRIERRRGHLTYVAQVKGASEVEFPLAVQSADAIEFANPAHDFPQRIRYWREGQLLMIELAMIDGSKAQRFNYRPVEITP